VHAVDADSPVFPRRWVRVCPGREDAQMKAAGRALPKGQYGMAAFQFTKVIPGKYTVVAPENGWNLQWRNRK